MLRHYSTTTLGCRVQAKGTCAGLLWANERMLYHYSTRTLGLNLAAKGYALCRSGTRQFYSYSGKEKREGLSGAPSSTVVPLWKMRMATEG